MTKNATMFKSLQVLVAIVVGVVFVAQLAMAGGLFKSERSHFTLEQGADLRNIHDADIKDLQREIGGLQARFYNDLLAGQKETAKALADIAREIADLRVDIAKGQSLYQELVKTLEQGRK